MFEKVFGFSWQMKFGTSTNIFVESIVIFKVFV